VETYCYLPRIALLLFAIRVSGEQTVLDAREIASPTVVARFAKRRRLDGLGMVYGGG
jgi:hypothetical protein